MTKEKRGEVLLSRDRPCGGGVVTYTNPVTIHTYSTWFDRDSTWTTLTDLKDRGGETVEVDTRTSIVSEAEERNGCRRAQTREGPVATIDLTDAEPTVEDE